MQAEITLVNLMTVFESELSSKTKVLLDTTHNVERFLTYKGTTIEVNKLDLKFKLNKVSSDDLDTEIRKKFVYSMKGGDKLAFFADTNVNFNLREYLKQFQWYDDATFWDINNLQKRDYFVKHKLLVESEDVDNFGNKGCWEPKEKARYVVLFNGKDEDLSTIKENYPSDLFEIIIVR